MPAVVTTPLNVAFDGISARSDTTNPTFTAFASRTPTTPVVAPRNVAGVTHFVMAPPLRRWNGTAWVAQYVPR